MCILQKSGSVSNTEWKNNERGISDRIRDLLSRDKSELSGRLGELALKTGFHFGSATVRHLALLTRLDKAFGFVLRNRIGTHRVDCQADDEQKCENSRHILLVRRASKKHGEILLDEFCVNSFPVRGPK